MNPKLTPAASAVPSFRSANTPAGQPHDVRRPIVTKLATIGLRLFSVAWSLLTAPIDFARAVFGDELEVETFEGRLCDCAEGYHRDEDACLLDGVAI